MRPLGRRWRMGRGARDRGRAVDESAAMWTPVWADARSTPGAASSTRPGGPWRSPSRISIGTRYRPSSAFTRWRRSCSWPRESRQRRCDPPRSRSSGRSTVGLAQVGDALHSALQAAFELGDTVKVDELLAIIEQAPAGSLSAGLRAIGAHFGARRAALHQDSATAAAGFAAAARILQSGRRDVCPRRGAARARRVARRRRPDR